jgi:hypothetical protein
MSKKTKITYKPIYTITVLNYDFDKGHIKDSRCWFYWHTLSVAKRSVLENYTDMFECGQYNLAVIEELKPGFNVVLSKEWWYAATTMRREENEDYEYETLVKPTTKPQGLSNVIHFGIG